MIRRERREENRKVRGPWGGSIRQDLRPQRSFASSPAAPLHTSCSMHFSPTPPPYLLQHALLPEDGTGPPGGVVVQVDVGVWTSVTGCSVSGVGGACAHPVQGRVWLVGVRTSVADSSARGGGG